MSSSNALLEQRAVSLATMFLTRHPDVVVQHGPNSTGLDLLAEIMDKGNPVGRMFGVEVTARLSLPRVGRMVDRGRLKLESHLRIALVSAQRKIAYLPFPALFMVFTMDSDRGFYNWLREPVIRNRQSALSLAEVEYAASWGSDTHKSVVNDVNAWYAARSNA
jgi:hypothetical protein